MEFDRATGRAVDERLARLIADDADVAVTEPVAMEVLAGAKTDEREAQLRRMLLRFHLLPFDSVIDFDAAVRIYRTCRQEGVAPRGLVACMIAAVALRHGTSLLAQDADLRRIADVMAIPLDPGSG